MSVVKNDSVIKIFQKIPPPTLHKLRILYQTLNHTKKYTPKRLLYHMKKKKTLYVSISTMFIPFIGNVVFLNAVPVKQV